MKFENINVQKAIDNAKKALSQDKGMSSATKAVMELILVIISILIQKLNINSSNSSKPPSQDPNRLKKKKFKQYDFILIANLNGIALEYNKLYLQVEDNTITYQCLSQDNTIIQGSISPTDLPEGTKFPKSDTLSELVKIRKVILQITE